MNLFFSNPRNKNQGGETVIEPRVITPEPPHNITEGSEFLDDAIRTHEQPLMYTEESIAVGCPDDLL